MKRKSPKRKSTPKPRIKETEEPIPEPAAPAAMFWLMPALSGFAALIYQILWMRQVSFLLGSTSQAAALTLAVFFGGLSMGAWYWGKRCAKISRPLRTYAWLELGIGAAGIALFIAPALVPHVYPMLGEGWAIKAFKFTATLLMVFPASFLMGGTLPLLASGVSP